MSCMYPSTTLSSIYLSRFILSTTFSLSIHLSLVMIYLPVPSIFTSSILFYLSTYPHISLSICLVYLSLSLFIYLSLVYLSMFSSTYLSIYLSIFRFSFPLYFFSSSSSLFLYSVAGVAFCVECFNFVYLFGSSSTTPPLPQQQQQPY